MKRLGLVFRTLDSGVPGQSIPLRNSLARFAFPWKEAIKIPDFASSMSDA
jgi:hypothetical protein